MDTTQKVSFNLETVPRTKEELKILGRFRLREIAALFGMVDSAAQRADIAALDITQLVDAVYAKVQELEKEAPAAAAPPVVTAPPVVEVAPVAVTPSGRQPRGSAKATAAAAAVAAPTEVTIPPEVVALLQTMQAQLSEIKGTMAAVVAGAAAQKASLDELLYQQSLGTALSLFFAEETLGGARPEILKQALADIPDIKTLVGKARQG
jgi:hypothetical protein